VLKAVEAFASAAKPDTFRRRHKGLSTRTSRFVVSTAYDVLIPAAIAAMA
jgi:hypothetical protein